MKRWIIGLAALALALPLAAETLTVTETTQGKTVRHTTTVTRTEADGLSWITSTSSEGTSRTGLTPAGELRTLEWSSPEGKATLVSDGSVVKLTGTYQGKTLSGSLELKGRIWGNGFDEPLRWYSRKGFAGPMPFLMVNLTDMAHPMEMVLTKEGEETIGGKKLVRLKVGLTGAMALFWSAKIWADPVTGEQVRYQGTKGPGTPESTITIESSAS